MGRQIQELKKLPKLFNFLQKCQNLVLKRKGEQGR